jgi:hypothetical protein
MLRRPGQAWLLAVLVILGLLSAMGIANAQERRDEYGVLAFAPSVSEFFAFYAPSTSEAGTTAFGQCSQAAGASPGYNSDCQLPIWVHNGWIALAADNPFSPGIASGPWGTGYGATDQIAIHYADQICRNNGGRQCSIRYVHVTYYFDPSQPTDGGGPIPTGR